MMECQRDGHECGVIPPEGKDCGDCSYRPPKCPKCNHDMRVWGYEEGGPIYYCQNCGNHLVEPKGDDIVDGAKMVILSNLMSELDTVGYDVYLGRDPEDKEPQLRVKVSDDDMLKKSLELMRKSEMPQDKDTSDDLTVDMLVEGAHESSWLKKEPETEE